MKLEIKDKQVFLNDKFYCEEKSLNDELIIQILKDEKIKFDRNNLLSEYARFTENKQSVLIDIGEEFTEYDLYQIYNENFVWEDDYIPEVEYVIENIFEQDLTHLNNINIDNVSLIDLMKLQELQKLYKKVSLEDLQKLTKIYE